MDAKRDKSPSKSRKSSGEVESIEITFKKCPSYKSSSRKSSVEDEREKRKSSPIPKENLLYGTSSSSENEHKKISPDRKSSSERSPLRSPKHLQEEESAKTLKKMSPSSRDKRVSFESKEEKEKKEEPTDKEREDSLPPPDFEENYLIAQSDILRQASIEYDRRMQEHKEMLQKMRQDEHFDETTNQDFPDFETWMEEREKAESRKSSLEKPETEDRRLGLESKPHSMANLRDEVLIEVSVEEGSFDSVDKHSEEEPPIQILVQADIEPVPADNDPILPILEETEAEIKQDIVRKYSEYFSRIREIIMVEYLKETEMSLKDDRKVELVKQDSIKEMRRSIERKLRDEPKVERRRRSEEKSPVTGKNREARQRRSLSFDEEILI